MVASLVSLNKAQVLILSTVGSHFFTLSRFRVSYSSSWILFQLYGESFNVSYIVHFFRWSFLCQKLPKSLLCHAHCSRIKPLLAILQLHWPFVLTIPWYQFITSCFRQSLSWNSVQFIDPIIFWLTLCWMMEDALMPSFQWISSYRIQHTLL